ncbi:LysR substrate-binding domain-containing protein [Pseudoalteromonas sp.]|uniref:LysR family transcriptional regulator n=1 Tax=Pseudoalteromonas sp. TaxID=53249 RepID=UPI0035620A3A
MLPEFKITQLRHFVWVAELKGFHYAAQKACRTQPAISLSIRDLENKLGADVFEKRSTKSTLTELTPFGRSFLPKAKELLAHHDSISQDMVLMRQHKTGHLRLASVPSVGCRILPNLLAKFVADLPDLHISIYDDNSDTVLKKVEKQQVDLGIASLSAEHEHDNVMFTPIWQDEIGVVCHKDNALATATELHWHQLKQQRFISNGTTRLLKKTAAEPLLANSQFYISNMLSLIAMLETNIGITTLPRFAFPQHNTTLCFIPLKTPHVVREVGLVQLKNKSLAPAAQALTDYILKHGAAQQ